MQVHLKKKEYKCTECSMAFGQSGSLARHVSNKHKNERKHLCPNELCGKAFATKWSAKSHNVSILISCSSFFFHWHHNAIYSNALFEILLIFFE